MTRNALGRLSGGALLLVAVLATLGPAAPTAARARQEGTPSPAYTCDTVSPSDATPGTGTGMPMGTPMAGMDHGGMVATPGAVMGVEFDQLYIDMMIPHHAAIIAMAQAAAPLLSDERLREIAAAIVATQTPEIEELRGYREQVYGDSDPAPMDEPTMGMMDQAMPGMGTMEEMAFQMDAEAQVAAICSADNPDLAFIDLTIAHHRMAIVASEAALARAVHPEIADFARRVIDAQQREIETLTEIRAALAGQGTPASSPASDDHDHAVVDRAGLADALRTAGLAVDDGGSLAPDVPFPNAQGGTVLRLSGGGLAESADVQVYEYANEATAFADAAQILPDGTLPTVIIEWVAPPHFFKAGRVIVLYVGTDPAVLDALTALLGPQFAGQ